MLLALSDPPAEARLGHCVGCAAYLRDVRCRYVEHGLEYLEVPAWECPSCHEVYFHVGTINAIHQDVARRLPGVTPDRALL